MESEYYPILLKKMQQNEIKDLQLQKVFILQESFSHKGKTVRAITYKADYFYLDVKSDKQYVIDIKGVETDVFKLKYKMFIKKYPDIEFLKLRKKGQKWVVL